MCKPSPPRGLSSGLPHDHTLSRSCKVGMQAPLSWGMDMLGPGWTETIASLPCFGTYFLIQNQWSAAGVAIQHNSTKPFNPGSLGDDVSTSGFDQRIYAESFPYQFLTLFPDLCGVNLSLLSRNDRLQHLDCKGFLLQYPISTGRLPNFYRLQRLQL